MRETCPCPICNTMSELDSYDSVDVGIGSIRGNESWCCPTHGRWGLPMYIDVSRLCHTIIFEEGFRLFQPFVRFVPDAIVSGAAAGWVALFVVAFCSVALVLFALAGRVPR